MRADLKEFWRWNWLMIAALLLYLTLAIGLLLP